MSEFTDVENRIFEEYISDPKFFTSLILIRGIMESIWATDAPKLVQNYTDHGMEHSERVAEFVERLLKVNPHVKFSKQEIYLLLAGVYLHDIGMQCNIIKYPEVKEKAEKLGAKFDVEFNTKTANSYLPEQQNAIRKNHHYLSAAWIDYFYENKDSILYYATKSIPYYLVDDLMDICKFHSKLPITDCPDTFSHDPNNRKKMVAALLRLADELDISSRRVNIETAMLFNMNPENAVYWWLHNYTQVNFISHNKIHLTVSLHPEDFELYGSFIRENYITNFKNKNLPVIEVLVEQNIPLVIDNNSDVIENKRTEKFPPQISAIFDKEIKEKALEKGQTNRKSQRKSDFSVTTDNYQERKAEILSIAEEQESIIKNLRLGEIQSGGPNQGERISTLINNLQSETFKILVLGLFNSGKATFINALCGQSILPTSPLPLIRIPCRIKYADDAEKRAVLFSKPGMGKNGDDSPFQIPLSRVEEEIRKDFMINEFGTSYNLSRYQMLDLYYPIPLCKNNIEIIDYVSLEDPDNRDKVAKDYIPYMDVIIYCMSSNQIYTNADKNVLALLRAIKYKSIFFLMTKYDQIKLSFELGEFTEALFKEIVLQNLVPYTELGKHGIMFVDSLSALRGKINNDENLINASGICEVEQALKSFLFQEKGKTKLFNSLLILKDINRSAHKSIQSRMSMMQRNVEELKEDYKNVKFSLKLLETKRQLVIQKIDMEIINISKEVNDMIYSHFLGLTYNIKEWASEYEIETPIGFPATSKKIELAVFEVIGYLKEKIEEDTIKWCNSEFFPQVESSIEEMRNSLKDQIQDFIESIGLLQVHISLGEQLGTQKLVKQKEAPFQDQFINEILLDLLSPVILALSPMSLTIGVVGSVIAGNSLSIISIKKRIKKIVGERIAEEIGACRTEMCKLVENKIKESFVKIREELNSSFAFEISSISDEVETVHKKRIYGRLNIENEMKNLKDLEQKNSHVKDELGEIMYVFNCEKERGVCT